MKLVAYFSRNGENYTKNGIENLRVEIQKCGSNDKRAYGCVYF